MRVWNLAILAILVGCSEWNVNKITDDHTGKDTDEDTGIDGEDTGDTDVPEVICNGEDDDGDGLIDEGFRDSDGDGIADCEDDDCDVDPVLEMSVDIPEECEAVVVTVTDPWNVGIEWQYSAAGYGVIVMPAVGNITDDNGDGKVDDMDNPDIVFTTWFGNTLVALHGDGSGVIFEVAGYNGQAGVSIADVDNDGTPEIVAVSSGRIVAVDGTGTQEWTSMNYTLSPYPQPAVADLDNDGTVEVIVDTAVVDGSTGNHRFSMTGVSTSWRTPVPVDLDDDGTLEIILGEDVFSHTGSLEWSSSVSGAGNFAAVAQIDGDRGGETFFVSGSQVSVHDDDGSLIRTFTVPARNPGAPSIADYDGDGDVEIAVSGGQAISVHEIDGTQIWKSTIQDNSGLAGNSGYDINGDGQFELLYADEVALRIYDGANGNILYEDFNHASGTVWEYPVTADVDNDGSAEIVVASNSWSSSSSYGIKVFGHNGSGWAKSGPTWPTHEYAVSNINPDGSVPSPADLSWLGHNLFRARPTVDSPGAPDLIPVIGEVCVASCVTGPIKISWSVQNAGGVDEEAGVEVVLYSVASDDTLTERARATLPLLPAGTQIAGSEFELLPSEWEEGIVLSVDDPGTGLYGAVRECDESNNEATLLESFCD